jgi:hypothetical protein
VFHKINICDQVRFNMANILLLFYVYACFSCKVLLFKFGFLNEFVSLSLNEFMYVINIYNTLFDIILMCQSFICLYTIIFEISNF